MIMSFIREKLILIACVTLAVYFFIINAAFALSVESVRFGNHPDSARAVIELDEAAEFRAFVMTNPTRIIVDMPEFSWRVSGIQKQSALAIKDVRYGALGGGLSRIVIETSKPVMIQAAFMLPAQNGQSARLVIDFKSTTAQAMAGLSSQVHGPLQGQVQASPQTSAAKKPEAAKKSPPQIAKKKPVIIIDPGHGGQDPGARGANGAYEKHIVLAVGLELKRQLEATGQYQVRMTRDRDIFIPLRDRVKFARRNNGDLFISLHADSIRDDDVTGASVYTLSEKASDAETAKLAERENKSDIIAGIDLSNQEEDVANILLDLATRDTMNQSKFLANTVVMSMDQGGIRTLERPHRSAGFAVLKAVDIPSILVEMGYLTNKSEVSRLSSPDYRRKIAQTLKGSVDRYFEKIEQKR